MSLDYANLASISKELDQSIGIRQEFTRRACDHFAHQQDQIIAKAIAKVLGEDFPLEGLRGRIEQRQMCIDGTKVLFLDGRPLIEFFPLRTSEEHRNGSHFINLSLPYRLFDWELEP